MTNHIKLPTEADKVGYMAIVETRGTMLPEGWKISEYCRGEPSEYRNGPRTESGSAAVWRHGYGWVAVVRGMALRGPKGRPRIFGSATSAMQAAEAARAAGGGK